MTEQRTFTEAAAEFSRGMREFQRILTKDVLPEIERLTVQIRALRRVLYLQRLRRWIPFWGTAIMVGLLLGWWLS